MKDISGQLELKYIKAKNLKIKRSRFCGDHVLFGSHSVDWVFGSLVVAIIFLLFRWLVPYLFINNYCFIEAFLLDLTGLFFAAITIRRCSTATAKLPANSMGYLCCVRSGVRNLCFIGRRRLFPFRKQAMPFLTVDAILGNQACHN